MQAVDMQAVDSRCFSCRASAMAEISRDSVDATRDFSSSFSDILCPFHQASTDAGKQCSSSLPSNEKWTNPARQLLVSLNI